jgi:hypothetical protein
MLVGGGTASGGRSRILPDPLPYFVHAPSLHRAGRQRSGRSVSFSGGERSISTGCFAGCLSCQWSWSGRRPCGPGLGLGWSGMRRTIWPVSVGTIPSTS